MWTIIKSEWTLLYTVELFSGLVVALLLLAIPKKALLKIRLKYTWFTPNFISVARLPFIYVGYILIFSEVKEFVGLMLVIAGHTADRLDGKLAEAMDESGIPGLVGVTLKGKWLDPLADKLAYLPMFIVFAVRAILPWWSVVFMFVIEAYGTVTRPPFAHLKPFKKLSGLTKGPGATGFGKTKAYLQGMTGLVCFPFCLRWVESPLEIPYVVFGIATLFAVLSVLSRIRFSRKVDALTDQVTKVFHHE